MRVPGSGEMNSGPKSSGFYRPETAIRPPNYPPRIRTDRIQFFSSEEKVDQDFERGSPTKRALEISSESIVIEDLSK